MADKHFENDYSNEVASEVQVIQPSFQEVVLLNDDFTTMQFVVSLLMEVFDKNLADANAIMMHVHTKGEGVCGVYPYDIAELKVSLSLSLAEAHSEPLRVIARNV